MSARFRGVARLQGLRLEPAFGTDNCQRADTLVLVTADHNLVLTIAGYPANGKPNLGIAIGVENRGEPAGEPIIATDGKPYTTLGQRNRAGAVQARPRAVPCSNATDRKHFWQERLPIRNAWQRRCHTLFIQSRGAGPRRHNRIKTALTLST